MMLFVAVSAIGSGVNTTSQPGRLTARSVLVPACSTATAAASVVPNVTTQFVTTQASPFGVAFGPEGRWAFVMDGDNLDVYRVTSFRLRLSGEISLPLIVSQDGGAGLTISPDGRYLAAAVGGGAVIIDVARAEAGSFDSVLGTLTSGGDGAIESAFSSDGAFLFVTLEDSDDMAVFDLAKALRTHFRSSHLVGTVPLESGPVGVVVSPDGDQLYATSEGQASSSFGTLTTVDVTRAETDPAHAVVSTVAAGCEPVRVVATSHNVFVTARASDEVLEFSAPALVSDPGQALLTDLRVGEAPVGIGLFDDDLGILVADSNRFGAPDAHANLALINVLSGGRLHLAGYVRSGYFPRDVATVEDGRILLVSNYDSGQVELVIVPKRW